MIIQTGQRTDIPAFYSQWLLNRLKEGFVMVRNPFYPESVSRYELNPKIVDLITFCTKNPLPVLQNEELWQELSAYNQWWYVTLTPYGKEIEPNVPGKAEVAEGIIELGKRLGSEKVGWRYDIDFLYLKQHPDFRAFSIYENAINFENEFMPIFAKDAFENRRQYICWFYRNDERGELEREYKYLTPEQAEAFVQKTVEKIKTIVRESIEF